MGMILLIYLTMFAAVICGAVILIQMGGLLAILSAILIIIHFFVTGTLLVFEGMFCGTGVVKVKKEEVQNHERMGV